MLDKVSLLFYSLIVHTMCSPVYPALRFEDRSNLRQLLSTSPEETGMVQDGGIYEDKESGVDSTGQRTDRHADAVFTNTYRKVLGQISARKLLDSIMAQKLGDDNFLAKRHSDDIFTDNYARYQRQMAIRNYLAAILGNQSRLENINMQQLPEIISAPLEADYGTIPTYVN
ncbi:glucagon family neuropeptides-like isoform X1 [Leucoraja erinacea]|uniref:glucagon family neuropeptides-like isoform X1 n=2 Tax=Leucoraja erinaceus TaxID=7782 RepID=UPI0024580A7B|nr:glucagon family neuropeptides-like isoform X1 [Leucoraja erinacea]XP_055508327.1 glucagon family neuropeptides-like isoform X1 [Leucoraja erinacea]